MSKLDNILFFQSEPMSSNMLADWQIKQAKQQIKDLFLELIGESYAANHNETKLALMLRQKVEEL
jgi:hypothetical protein